MKNLELYGFLYGPNEHYLDHICPICCLLDIPLIVTEKNLEEAALTFYPDLVTIYYHYDVATQQLMNQANCIISCFPIDMLNELFFLAEKTQNKKLVSIWCPHGNSEKGYGTYFAEVLQKERIVLCYGDKVMHRLKVEKAHHHIPHIIEVGNYRYQYYLRMKKFYDKLIEKTITSMFDKDKKTICFAPSWDNPSQIKDLIDFIRLVIQKLSPKYNLLIKPHPNSYKRSKHELEALEYEFNDNPLVKFIYNFPCIYPILDQSDLLISTKSSVVFDFLLFDRPILLYEDKQPFADTITQTDLLELDSIVDYLFSNPSELSNNRKEHCSFAFYSNISIQNIKMAITNAAQQELK